MHVPLGTHKAHFKIGRSGKASKYRMLKVKNDRTLIFKMALNMIKYFTEPDNQFLLMYLPTSELQTFTMIYHYKREGFVELA